jgi:hypothetical protein
MSHGPLPQLPVPGELPAKPRRIILHWTAGLHRANSGELQRYHLCLEHLEHLEPSITSGFRTVWRQGVPLERNMRSLSGVRPAHLSPRGYAAHTGGFNSYSIGVAYCGMAEAVDYRPRRPVDPGTEPITAHQVEGMVEGLVELCRMYQLEPIPEQLFDHWEAHHLHGREQRGGVWDCQWVPGEELRRGEVGDWMRERVQRRLADRLVVPAPSPEWRGFTAPEPELKPPEPPQVTLRLPLALYRPVRALGLWWRGRH